MFNKKLKKLLSVLALFTLVVPAITLAANNFVLSADTNFSLNFSNTGDATTIVGLSGAQVVSTATGANYIDVVMENGSSMEFQSTNGYTISGTVTSGSESDVTITSVCNSITDSRLSLSATGSVTVRVQVSNSTAHCSTSSGGGGGSSTTSSSDASDDGTASDTTNNDSDDGTDDQSTDGSSTTDTAEDEVESDANVVCSMESQVAKIVCEAQIVIRDHVKELTQLAQQIQNTDKEQSTKNEYFPKLGSKISALSMEFQEKIVNFIAYGTQQTKSLGEGERAGTIDSFQSAFHKLPQSQTDWEDVIKIAAGRWPSQANEQREAWATERFEEIYLRIPDRKNQHDDAAVVIIAYGLRPHPRNTASEAAAITTFKSIFNHVPQSAEDWDMVRAIAYSGATR